MASKKGQKEKPEGTVNAPRVIWMTNDLGGFIRVSDLYLWIKFSDSPEEQVYKITGDEILKKFRKFKKQFRVAGGKLLFLPNEVVEDGEPMLVIEIIGKPEDNFRVVVPREEVKQVFYDFEAVKVVGY